MLHRTTTAQLLLVLATALVELPPGSALLVYLSADGLHAPTTTPAPSSDPDGGGGGSKSGGGGDHKGDSSSLAAPLPSSTGRSSPAASLNKGDTSSVSAASPAPRLHDAPPSAGSSDGVACMGAGGASSPVVTTGGGLALAVPSTSAEALRGCCLSAADLLPFCRVPLFLVVDSDNASAFASLPELAALEALLPPHVLCLLAPCPSSSHELGARKASMLAGGGLLTLFLHEPIAAICALCDIQPPSEHMCGSVEADLADAYFEITAALAKSECTPAAAIGYLADPFLRMLMLRFAICDAAIHAFRPTKRLLANGSLLPAQCVPALPLEATREALKSLRRVAEALKVADRFDFDEPHPR